MELIPIPRSRPNSPVAGCISAWNCFRIVGLIAPTGFEMTHSPSQNKRFQDFWGAGVGDRLKLGVVGAGAVLDRYHTPAINGVPEVIRAIVIDADRERARRAADRYGFPK